MVFVCMRVALPKRPVEAIAAKAAQSAARSAAKSVAIATGRHGHENSSVVFGFCVLERQVFNDVYVYEL